MHLAGQDRCRLYCWCCHCSVSTGLALQIVPVHLITAYVFAAALRKGDSVMPPVGGLPVRGLQDEVHMRHLIKALHCCHNPQQGLLPPLGAASCSTLTKQLAFACMRTL